LLAARALLAHPMAAYDTAAFHAQQAAEKALKAVLVRHQVSFGRTHDIADLLLKAEGVAPEIRAALTGAESLTPFAVDARYPGAEPALGREEAIPMVDLAERVVDHVRGLLAPYLAAGRPSP
jgi:HEPN domain-containing protein